LLFERQLERIQDVVSAFFRRVILAEDRARTLTEHGQRQLELARQQLRGRPNRGVCWGGLAVRSELRPPRSRWFPLDRVTTDDFDTLRVKEAAALFVVRRHVIVALPAHDSE
jgi:hypothetical protein